MRVRGHIDCSLANRLAENSTLKPSENESGSIVEVANKTDLLTAVIDFPMALQQISKKANDLKQEYKAIAQLPPGTESSKATLSKAMLCNRFVDNSYQPQ